MALSAPVRAIRLGAPARVGAIVMAEQAVDTDLYDDGQPNHRIIALDILLRDLARQRFLKPGFIGAVERYIDLLHRELLNQVPPRQAA